MGRKAKVKDGVICTVILPQAFLDQMPGDMVRSDWIRQFLPLNGNSDVKYEFEAGITQEQKDAISQFIELFNTLLDKDLLDEHLSDDVIKAAEILQGMV